MTEQRVQLSSHSFFSSSSFFFLSTLLLPVLHSSFKFRIVQSLLCAPVLRLGAEGVPRRIIAVAHFRASSLALCKNSTLVEVFSILVFFFFRLLFQVDTEHGAPRRYYLISVHSHNSLSWRNTLSHILLRSFFFFPNVPSSYEATGIVYSLPYFYFLQVFCCALLLKASVTVASHKKNCVYILFFRAFFCIAASDEELGLADQFL